MVVREAVHNPGLISKARVVVPGQYIVHSKQNPAVGLNCNLLSGENAIKTSNVNKRVETKKNVSCQTEQFVCSGSNLGRCHSDVCPAKSKRELWNLQLDRWWGWNWLRKRKNLLSKFHFKVAAEKCPQFNTEPNRKESSTPRNENKTTETEDKLKQKKSLPKGRGKCECLFCSLELYHPKLLPVPPVHTCSLNKSHTVPTKRRARNGTSQFEAWVKDSSSSTSSDNVSASKVRNVQCSSAKKKVEDLLLRLQHLNSSTFIKVNKRKMPAEKEEEANSCKKCEREINKTKEIPLKSTANSTAHLYPVEVNDERINNMNKVQNSWLKDYHLLKQEHNDLLTTICDVLCKSSFKSFTEATKLQSDLSRTKPFVGRDVLHTKPEPTVFNINTSRNKDFLKKTSTTLQNEPFCISQELFSANTNTELLKGRDHFYRFEDNARNYEAEENLKSFENNHNSRNYETGENVKNFAKEGNLRNFKTEIKANTGGLETENIYVSSEYFGPDSNTNSQNINSLTSFQTATSFSLCKVQSSQLTLVE